MLDNDAVLTSPTPPGNGPTNDGEGTAQALLQSFLMIIFSEIGDKTFLIAAILAMRHPRVTVFLGAFSSLVVMSLLSAMMGHILPTLIPRRWTQFAAAILFLVFGAKMLVEAKGMKGGSEKIREEMKEAEEEIEGDEINATGGKDESMAMEEMEGGGRRARRRSSSRSSDGRSTLVEDEDRPTPLPMSPVPRKKESSYMEGARNFCSLVLGPVFVQAFVLTFLGEWGDRSQIATIALGAAHNVYLVTFGTIFGHSCCTALAVIGGRYVSTKISVKHVTFGGAVLFLIFGVLYLYETFTMPGEVEMMTIPMSKDSK